MNKIIILKQTVMLKQSERKLMFEEFERELALGYLVVPPGFELAEENENTRIYFDSSNTGESA